MIYKIIYEYFDSFSSLDPRSPMQNSFTLKVCRMTRRKLFSYPPSFSPLAKKKYHSELEHLAPPEHLQGEKAGINDEGRLTHGRVS
jgi:hypothetical protein